MANSPKPHERDPKDAAEARQWAEEMRRRGEAGSLSDDSTYLKRKLAQERRKPKRR